MADQPTDTGTPEPHLLADADTTDTDIDADDGTPAAEQTTIQRSRAARSVGDLDRAIEILEDELRSGSWDVARLWTERLSLMASVDDYDRIRDLWLASPKRVHRNPAILRPVARAASVAGRHAEARALLRAAILSRAAHRRSPRGVAGRARRAARARLRARSGAPVSFEGKAAVALADLDELLDDLGVRVFLISGTLLGHIRSAGFIPWDKDIDVGVFRDEVDVAELERVVDGDPRFNVRRLDLTSDRLRINHVTGTMIDVFPHYLEDDGKVWHDGTATRWWNSPFELTEVEFLGQPTLVPDPPERYLDENYGDWRTPDPTFDARLDAPNVQVTDQGYFDTLLYFSLLDAVTKRDRRKALRFARLLRRLGEGEWLRRTLR
jgi:hypothetical protein